MRLARMCVFQRAHELIEAIGRIEKDYGYRLRRCTHHAAGHAVLLPAAIHLKSDNELCTVYGGNAAADEQAADRNVDQLTGKFAAGGYESGLTENWKALITATFGRRLQLHSRAQV